MQDVEDSELMEMMDVCDQESKLNRSTQQDDAHADRTESTAAQVIKEENWLSAVMTETTGQSGKK